jgi:hypothetical protein
MLVRLCQPLTRLAGPFFIYVTAYDTIAKSLSRTKLAVSKNNLICAGVAEDFTRTLREQHARMIFENCAEFKLPPRGWGFIE